nr:uncharacterized protein LOC112932540 [Vulpes vulpes]
MAVTISAGDARTSAGRGERRATAVLRGTCHPPSQAPGRPLGSDRGRGSSRGDFPKLCAAKGSIYSRARVCGDSEHQLQSSGEGLRLFRCVDPKGWNTQQLTERPHVEAGEDPLEGRATPAEFDRFRHQEPDGRSPPLCARASPRNGILNQSIWNHLVSTNEQITNSTTYVGSSFLFLLKHGTVVRGFRIVHLSIARCTRILGLEEI